MLGCPELLELLLALFSALRCEKEREAVWLDVAKSTGEFFTLVGHRADALSVDFRCGIRILM